MGRILFSRPFGANQLLQCRTTDLTHSAHTYCITRVGQKRIHTVYDRMYGNVPAKSTVYTLYIPKNVWFWPTLCITCCCKAASRERNPATFRLKDNMPRVVRVGQNHIYKVYIGCFWQGYHQIFRHTVYIYGSG